MRFFDFLSPGRAGVDAPFFITKKNPLVCPPLAFCFCKNRDAQMTGGRAAPGLLA
jgi:hypothetical protein